MTNDKDLFSQINNLFEDVNLDQATNLIGGKIKPTGEEYEQELMDKLNATDAAATEKLVEDISHNVKEGEDLQDSIKSYLRTKLGLTLDENDHSGHTEIAERVEEDARLYMKNPELYEDNRTPDVDPSIYMKDGDDTEVVLPDPSIREDYITDMSRKLSQVLDQHGMRERWAKSDDPEMKGDIYEKVEALSAQLNLLRTSVMESTMVSGIGQGGDGQLPGSGEVRLQKMDDVIMGEIEPGQTICWDPDYFGPDHGAWVPCDGGGGGGGSPIIQPPLQGDIFGCTKIKDCADLYWGTEAQYQEFVASLTPGPGEVPDGAELVKEEVTTISGSIAVEYVGNDQGGGTGEFVAIGLKDCDGKAITEEVKHEGTSGDGTSGFFLVYENESDCSEGLEGCPEDLANTIGCKIVLEVADEFTNEVMWGDQADYDADPQTGTPVLDINGDPLVGVTRIYYATFEGCDKDTRKGKYNVYYLKPGGRGFASIYDDTDGVETRGFFIANAVCAPTEPEPDPDQKPVFGCLAADGCKEVEVVDAATDVGNLMYGDGTSGVAVLDADGNPITDAQKIFPNPTNDPDEIYVVEDDGSVTAVWVLDYTDFNGGDKTAKHKANANSPGGCKEGFYIESDNDCLNPNEKPDGSAQEGNLLGCLETNQIAATIMWGQPGLGVPARAEPGGNGSIEPILAKRLLIAFTADDNITDDQLVGQWTVMYEDSSGAKVLGYSPTGSDDGTDDGFYLDVGADECEDGGTEKPEFDKGIITGCRQSELGSPVYWGTRAEYLAHQNIPDYTAAGIPIVNFADGSPSDNVVRIFPPRSYDKTRAGGTYTSFVKLVDDSLDLVTFPNDGTLAFSPPDGFFLAQGLCKDGEDPEDNCSLEQAIPVKPEGCQSVTKDGGDLLWGKISAIDEDYADTAKYEVVDTNVTEILRVTTDDYCDNNYGVFTCYYLKDGEKFRTTAVREGFNPGDPVEDTEAFFLNPGDNKCADEIGRPDFGGDITGCRRTLDEAGTNLYWGSSPQDILTPATDENGDPITDAKFIVAVVSFDADINKVGNWACIYNKPDGTTAISREIYGSSPSNGYLLEDDNCELEPCDGKMKEGHLPDCNEVDANGDAGDLYWETGNGDPNINIGVKARRVLATWTVDDCTEDPFDLATPKIWTALYLDENGKPAVAGAELGVSPFGGYYIEVDDINSFCDYDTTNPPGGACDSDKDCPPGFECVGGICEQIRCSLDECPGEDCKCPDGFVCVQGICLRPCGVEGGPLCPDGSHCISVPDPDGIGPDFTVCVPGPGCNGDCPEGYFCLDGECVILECSLNPDNSVDAEENGCPPGYKCYNGQCLKPCDINAPEPCPPGFECIDTVTDGFLCFPINGPCPPNAPDGADDGCPPGYECILGACRKPCSDTEPCPDGFQCFNGVCLPEGPDFPNCTDDSCPEGTRCIGGICVPHFGCEDDDDCGLDNFECLGGICRPVCDPNETDPCPNGMDCIDGICLELCNDDTECPEGHVCIAGTCRPILGCSDTEPCPDGFDCIDGTCRRPCIPANCPPDAADDSNCECPPGTACWLGHCYPICTEDTDCPPGHQCVNGICLPDFSCDPENDTCPSGMQCVDGTCRPVCPGGDDTECPPGFGCFEGHCFPLCSEETDCPPDHHCIGGKCIPMLGCDDTHPCPGNMQCIDGTCRPVCPDGEDSTCPEGFGCFEGICVPLCDDGICPPDHHCIGGKCIPMLGCENTGDCPGDMQCVNGVCRLYCDEDKYPDSEYPGTGGCPEGHKCFLGVCYPTCDATECPPGHICVGGICVPVGGCDPDASVDPCPPGFSCAPDGICRPDCDKTDPDNPVCPPGFTCFGDHCFPSCENTDCPPGYECYLGICLPPFFCQDGTDGSCPADWICIDGICRPACDPDLYPDNNGCPDGFTCIDGGCWLECNADRPCPDGYACVGGVCRPIPGCSEDGDCPVGHICLNGVCVKECDPNSNDSCPPGFVCTELEGGLHVCLIGCNDNFPCPDGYTCWNGTCYPLSKCDEDNPCPEGYECLNGTCVKVCDPTDDDSCPPGYICTPTDDGGNVCLLQCTEPGDCPPGTICVDGICVPQIICDKEHPCPDGFACYNGVCIPSCGDGGQCPPGFECVDGFCLKPCANDGECPLGFVCHDGYCRPGGLPNGPCGPNDECPKGFECIDGICRQECTDDTVCPPNFICFDGHCLPVGRPEGPCGPEGCPPGYDCILGICRKPCAGDNDCFINEECIDPPGACMPIDCTDRDCPPGTICIDGRCRIDCSDGTECKPGYICTPVGDGSICLPISPGPDGPEQPVEPGPLPHDKIGCEEVDISGTLYWGSEQDYIAGTGEAVIKDGAIVKARKIHAIFVTDLYPNGIGDYTCFYSEPGSDDIESVELNRQSPLNGLVHSYYIDPDDGSTCINAGATHDPVDGFISGCKETDRGGNLYWGTTAEALDPNQNGVKLYKDGAEIICKGIISVVSIDSEDPNDGNPGQIGTWQIFYRTLDGGNDMVAYYGRSGPFGPEGAYMEAVEGSICIDSNFNVVTTRDVILVNSPRLEKTRQGIIGDGPNTGDIIGPNGEVIKYNTQEQANFVFTDLLLHLDTYKPTVQILLDINDAPDWYVPKKGDLWIDPSDYSIYVADLVGDPSRDENGNLIIVPDGEGGMRPLNTLEIRERIRTDMERYVAWIEIGGGGEAGSSAAKGSKVYYDEAPHVPGSGPGSPDIAALTRGDLWIDSNTLITYVWNNTSESWISTTGDLNAIFDNRFEVHIAPNPPTKEFTKSGDLWFDSEFAEMRIAYVPADSGGDFVWVPVQGTGLKAAPSTSSFSTEEEVDELRTQVLALTARLDAIDSNY